MAREKKAEKRKSNPDKDRSSNTSSTSYLQELNGDHEDNDLFHPITNDDDSTDAEYQSDSEVESNDEALEIDDSLGEKKVEDDDDDGEEEEEEIEEIDKDRDSREDFEENTDEELEEETDEELDEGSSEEIEDDSNEEIEEDSNEEIENGEEEQENIKVEKAKENSHIKRSTTSVERKEKQLPKKNKASKNKNSSQTQIQKPINTSKGKGNQIKGDPNLSSLSIISQSSKQTTASALHQTRSKSVENTVHEEDEYKSDTSDEEDIRNTVGNIPMNWYDDYPHLGYDWDGKKIIKPKIGDELDNFLKRMEDPNFWRTVKDPQTGQDVVLCDADVDLIQRLQAQKIPDEQFDEYAPWIEWFSSQVMKTPIRKFPEHKRSFLPSQSEKEKVGKIVHAIKMGWIKPRREREKKKDNEPQFYMLWKADDEAEEMRRVHDHIPAPKRLLPGNAESYNPPAEYLFDEREMEEWKKLKETPSKRKLHFIPQKYNSLREVPAYGRYIKERFLRCLDLYLCPRARKLRLTIEPEDLVPQLPSPKDLQPFPTTQAMVYKGHTDMVRSITVEPKGQYLVSGSDDMTIKIWEVSTGRCVRTVPVGGVVRSVSWCPNQALSLIAVAADRKVLLINPGVGDRLIGSKTDTLLEEPPEQDMLSSERVKSAVSWEQATGENWDKGIRVVINHFKEVRQVAWHGRGDYFATVMPEGQNRSVLIHQLSKRRSQVPFSKSKGLIQCVLFHPVRPFFFVATQRNVRIYDLAKQEMVKKLLSNAKWISSMAIHPGGDNLLVGTYDRKLLWFDLDLSTQPYQSLKLHGAAVRGVAYHKRYPLFASGSDDRNLIVSHGMVYNDLLQNPLIVPLKRLSYHTPRTDFGIFDVLFHPTQPWVFSSASDYTVRLYT